MSVGAEAVEFDLHTASDGTPVLIHDPTLDRTTDGHGPVSARSPAELGALDAGRWFGPSFAGEPVPTFARALALLEGRVHRVYAEVKGMRAPGDAVRFVEDVRAAGVVDRTVFISMDWHALERIRRADPDALVGYIVEQADRTPEAFERAQGDRRALLDYDARILAADPTIAKEAARAGIVLATWTVDTTDLADTIFAQGVRRITTNQVERLLAWASRLSLRPPPSASRRPSDPSSGS